MPITYSCFISYRHDTITIARDFQEDLENELSLLIDLPVYRDEERLQGGQFFNDALAYALCQSACMVVIYTPKYFDEMKPYCAREYKAMEQLETDRLLKLNKTGKSNVNGLIIPVVYRGYDSLPKLIRDNRQCCNFEAYLLGGRTQRHNKKYLTDVKNIASYIFHRCRDFKGISPDPCGRCKSFEIPPKSQISRWLNSIQPNLQVFPGRGA